MRFGQELFVVIVVYYILFNIDPDKLISFMVKVKMSSLFIITWTLSYDSQSGHTGLCLSMTLTKTKTICPSVSHPLCLNPKCLILEKHFCHEILMNRKLRFNYGYSSIRSLHWIDKQPQVKDMKGRKSGKFKDKEVWMVKWL